MPNSMGKRKLSHKLDTLQAMVREYAGKPHHLYLIALLAEHSEEAEITADVLAWVTSVLKEPA